MNLEEEEDGEDEQVQLEDEEYQNIMRNKREREN